MKLRQGKSSAKAKLVNSLWMASASKERKAFENGVANVRSEQEMLLLSTLRANQDSSYGKEYSFGQVRNVDDFRRLIPTSDSNTIRPLVERIASGESKVLTSERVNLLEPTSGSTDGLKLIPYTSELGKQFQRAVHVWIGDLFRQRPGLRSGQAYWSISPVGMRRRESSGGIPIGFDQDADYLGRLGSLLAKQVLVAPPWLTLFRNLENFRFATLACLLSSPSLSLISVWSPSFFTVLCQNLVEWRDDLARLLRESKVRFPQPSEDQSLAKSLAKLLQHRVRRVSLERVIAGLESRKLDDWPDLIDHCWPNLQMISCWGDGQARREFDRIDAALHPYAIEVAKKGLIATEGIVSLPFGHHAEQCLAYRSHFFEFCEPNDSPNPIQDTRLAHELTVGSQYEVILTTGGGLYRYRLRDVVEVVDYSSQCPRLRFVGRNDRTSDLVGEKLNEFHVKEVLDELRQQERSIDFAILTSDARPETRGYVLFVYARTTIDTDKTKSLKSFVETGLSRNPYYSQATRLSQIQPLRIVVLDPAGRDPIETFQDACVSTGQRLGDIKIPSMETRQEILERLELEWQCSDRPPTNHQSLEAG